MVTHYIKSQERTKTNEQNRNRFSPFQTFQLTDFSEVRQQYQTELVQLDPYFEDKHLIEWMLLIISCTVVLFCLGFLQYVDSKLKQK